MSVFRLTMLPAAEGDSLILSYGVDETVLRHVLIDGGRKATWPGLKAALEAIAARGESIELLVLSHIDADHIDGLLAMIEAADLPLTPKSIWYNGFDQLQALVPPGGIGTRGFPVADAYSKALAAEKWAVNEAFGGKALFLEEYDAPFEFAGLKLTLVSPSRAKLWRLRSQWEKWRDTHPTGLAAKGKRPMPPVLDVEALSVPSPRDSTAPNGSSIAFVAEYDRKTVLLAADAHPDVLLTALTALAGPEGRCAVDLVKLPHHGSRANVTREVLEKLDCRRFAVSTSGAVFGHPDPEAIARILKFGADGHKILYFNYASERTLPWHDRDLEASWDYECVFPAAEGSPLAIDI